jgi:RNA polymerase sigma-70 factor (ECF subfamily)
MDAHALLGSLHAERARFVRLARRRVSTVADAEDIVQRALLRAAERAGSLLDPARSLAWFYRILRNAIADHHRTSLRDPIRHGDDAVEDLPDVATSPATAPCACARRLLDGLRPSYAEVIRRIDLDGEDPASLAAALGISQGNLDVRLHRARKSLRNQVCSYCGVGSHGPCLDCTCDGHRRCGSPA